MNFPDKKFIDLIKKHHVLTLATAINNVPYCASCFYAYDEENNSFIFTSDHKTRHAQEMLANSNVAAAIALETTMIGKIRGIQICGSVSELKEKEFKLAKKTYLHKFPIAALSDLVLWKLIPETMKLTDNRLGFGKKIFWEREQ